MLEWVIVDAVEHESPNNRRPGSSGVLSELELGTTGAEGSITHKGELGEERNRDRERKRQRGGGNASLVTFLPLFARGLAEP